MDDINTHLMFNTIGHEHLDDLVHWAIGEYPNSGLILVECEDGRWFIEQEYGHEFDSFSGISKPKIEPYLEPNFYLRPTVMKWTPLLIEALLLPRLGEESISLHYPNKNLGDSAKKCKCSNMRANPIWNTLACSPG